MRFNLGMKALFYGPTKQQETEMRKAEDVEEKYCAWLRTGEHTLDEARVKYAELRGEKK